MATLREIRRRIASIQNIEQVTDAMRVVAAARLRRAQENINATRPYADKLDTILGHLISRMDTETEALTHPLLEEREVKHVCIISVSGDRGLCGSFNSNVIRTTTQRAQHYQDSGADVTLICIGRRTHEHFDRRGYNISDAYTNIFRNLEFQTAADVVHEFEHLYVEKKIDKVEVIYNNFKSAILQTVLVEQLLPLVPEFPEGDTLFLDYIYEPGQIELFEMLLSRHLNMQMWKVLLDSNAAEQAARMAAMENATQKAKELIDELILQRNRARQTQITTEISEIVSGAAALEG
ncbi:ATP synthase F1 subunit gamma [Candidatus Poribacteria bacterium]|nr:MAG: ATP synthase F1 subunit gamma [Candidatus Poribacteria bacterium]